MARHENIQHFSELPDGYSFADKWRTPEVVELFNNHYPGDETTIEAWNAEHREYSEATLHVVGIAVRSIEHELVGFGSLAFKGVMGEMGQLVVHSKHRSRGIARAIVDERLRQATALGLRRLRMRPRPLAEAETNVLRVFYEERGFRFLASGWLC